jgi:signal peptidase II
MAVTMDWLSREKMTRAWRWAIPLIIGIVAVDQLTKAWVLGVPDFRALACLDDARVCGRMELSSVMDFSMTWNRGVSFGAMQAEGLARWILFGADLGDRSWAFTLWLIRAERRTTALALAHGRRRGCGKPDRPGFIFGAVVDFIDFSWPLVRPGDLFGWEVGFPWIFNVADASISYWGRRISAAGSASGRAQNGQARRLLGAWGQ